MRARERGGEWEEGRKAEVREDEEIIKLMDLPWFGEASKHCNMSTSLEHIFFIFFFHILQFFLLFELMAGDPCDKGCQRKGFQGAGNEKMIEHYLQ